MTPADLPTVRAAIEDVLSDWVGDGHVNPIANAILAKLSDPAVQDELARWLVAQEDGPFEVEFPGSELPVYRLLRQRTRSEP